MKQKLAQVFCTKAGWLWVCMILVVVFGSLSPWSTFTDDGFVWCGYAMWICFAYPAILSLIMFGYAIRNTFFGGGKND